MEHSRESLIDHILPLSESLSFDVARHEWKLYRIQRHKNFTLCPCGQRIKEVCHIKNMKNDKETYVGNVCVKNFLGIDTGNLFDGLKRIDENSEARPNEDLIIHANKMGYLYPKEYDFLMGIKRKRKLSDKQLRWLKIINRRITNDINVA